MPKIARVIVNVAGINKELDYLIPASLGNQIKVGNIVRVPFRSKVADAWVVAIDCKTGYDKELREVIKIKSVGPPANIIKLAYFGAWRFAGPKRVLLQAASPPRAFSPAYLQNIMAQTLSKEKTGQVSLKLGPTQSEILRELTSNNSPCHLRFRQPTPMTWLVASVYRKYYPKSLIVCLKNRDLIVKLKSELVQLRLKVAVIKEDWLDAFLSPAIILGTRDSVLAPVEPENLGGIIIFDPESSEFVEQRSPNWSAVSLGYVRAIEENAKFITVSRYSKCIFGVHDESYMEDIEVAAELERKTWPRFKIVAPSNPFEFDYQSEIVGLLNSARNKDNQRVAVYVERKSSSALCARCRESLTCQNCSELLLIGKDSTGKYLSCQKCSLKITASSFECKSCKGRRYVLSIKTAEQVRDEISKLVSKDKSVSLLLGSVKEPYGDIVVGTSAIFNPNLKPKAIVFPDFDRMFSRAFVSPALNILKIFSEAALSFDPKLGVRTFYLILKNPDRPLIRHLVDLNHNELCKLLIADREIFGIGQNGSFAVVSGSKQDIAELASDLESKEVDFFGPDEKDRYLLISKNVFVLVLFLNRISEEKGFRIKMEQL